MKLKAFIKVMPVFKWPENHYLYPWMYETKFLQGDLDTYNIISFKDLWFLSCISNTLKWKKQPWLCSFDKRSSMSSVREINRPWTPYCLIQEDLGIFLIPMDEELKTHGFPRRCKLQGYFGCQFMLSKKHTNDSNTVLTALREARLGRKLESNWKKN